MAVPYTFGSATTSIPLSQLDSNFATTITLGNTAVQLGNTITNLTGVSNVASATSLTLGSNGNTTAVTIDTSQNVGIGTTSPTTYGASTKFAVVSSSTAKSWLVGGSASGAYHYFSNNAQTAETNTFQIGQGWTSGSDNIGFLNTNGANPMLFATNGIEQMRIDSAGRIQVAGTTVVDSGRISVTFNSANSTGISVKASAAAGGTISQYWNSSNTSMGSIACNGTTVTYNSISDYRLKENITPMTGALDKVIQLKPVTYKWKANGSNGQGFIAHELQDVVPDCVTGEKDAVDSEGNPKYQQVDTSFLVATLTSALQETKALIDTQAETINALTARIVALESK